MRLDFAFSTSYLRNISALFCDWFENERRFVIMTTAANESMIKVHDRMPLILEKGQLKDWFDDRKMEQILHQVPVQLKREAEYEQQSLFL